MITSFRPKQTIYIGLAVHHERISLVKLKHIKRQPLVIDGFASLALPSGSIVDGKIHHPEHFCQAIKEWVTENQIGSCYTALALPVNQVINKKIRLAAYLNEAERHAEIAAHLKFYLPGMDERLYFDFFALENRKTAETDEMAEVELQLIAARAEQVELYIDLISSAGLTINIVDVDIYAIARSIQFLSHHVSNEAVVILDLDITSVQLILLKQGNVISVYPIVLETEEILLQQIKRGLQIFAAGEDLGVITEIFLTGYCKNFDTLQQLLQTQYSLKINKLTLFNAVSIDARLNPAALSARGSELLVAFGLALRGIHRA